VCHTTHLRIAGARIGGDGRTRYFAFRCAFGDLNPWVSYKRYSECLKLSDAIRVDPRAPNFPAKSWGISRLLAGEEELAALEEERQQALQTWFDHYLEQGAGGGDYGKFLVFFEVLRQQKLQGGEGGGEEARAGVAPDVTLCEGGEWVFQRALRECRVVTHFAVFHDGFMPRATYILHACSSQPPPLPSLQQLAPTPLSSVTRLQQPLLHPPLQLLPVLRTTGIGVTCDV